MHKLSKGSDIGLNRIQAEKREEKGMSVIMKKILLISMLLAAFVLSGCGGGEVKIAPERAREIALEKVPGATEENIRKFKKDRDDGRYVYEGEIVYNNMEYDFEIDADSGDIISWEAESAKNELFD